MTSTRVPLPRFLALIALILALGLSSCADNDDADETWPTTTTSRSVSADQTTGSAQQPSRATSVGEAGDRWQPALGDTWQWQLEGDLNLTYDVDVYDVDLFDTTQDEIDGIHRDGRRVICYFSAGSWEEWRSDAAAFDPTALGSTLDGWEDERWLDVTHPSVRSVMLARLDLAATKGCDGVEPDNVDAHDNDTGVSFSRDDQLAYNRWLAASAHERGLAVGLKNAVGLVDELVDSYDFAVNEECWAYDECEALSPFIESGKPVFHAEYDRRFVDDGGCAETTALGLQTLFLPLDLNDEFRVTCAP